MCDIVSVIITVLNGEKWIEKCFKSILNQNLCRPNSLPNDNIYEVALEVCVFDDASTDNTSVILNTWLKKFFENGIKLQSIRNSSGVPKGVGYGRNIAIQNSHGSYLCFQDIDDIMLPNRIIKQYYLAKLNKNTIIGSRFIRHPKNSTCRFTRWANSLTKKQLSVQIYTSHGPTIIMPTWFCHRKVFDRIPGGFCENGKGTPEDLIFFYKHLDLGGHIMRCNDILLIYRYHLNSTTFSVSEKTIWNIRLKKLIENVLNCGKWIHGFSIWNAGRQGRKFFRDLPFEYKNKVTTFCDVDKKKINRKYDYFDEIKRKISYSIPIVHFEDVKPPIIVCVKLDLTNGVFEENLKSLNLIEGKDYIIFS